MGACGTHVVGLRSNSLLFLNEYPFTLECPATMPTDGAVGTAAAAAATNGHWGICAWEDRGVVCGKCSPDCTLVKVV